jgi:hypothetical protein
LAIGAARTEATDATEAAEAAFAEVVVVVAAPRASWARMAGDGFAWNKEATPLLTKCLALLMMLLHLFCAELDRVEMSCSCSMMDTFVEGWG